MSVSPCQCISMKFLFYFVFVIIGFAFVAPAPGPRKPGKTRNSKYYLIETEDEPKDEDQGTDYMPCLTCPRTRSGKIADKPKDEDTGSDNFQTRLK